MDDYPLIANHGLIGDLQTAALVATDGSVDWFCVPRFDGPSVFGALLDHERGGRCRIRPAVEAFDTRQMYFPDTAILVTRFLTEEGVGELVDFMPVTGGIVGGGVGATDSHRLVRMVRCVRGRMRFDVEIAPRFDYGRARHELEVTDAGGGVPSGDGTTLTVHVVREPADERLGTSRTGAAGDVHFSLGLSAGQMRGLVLETAADGPPREIRVAEIRGLFDQTTDFWRSWLAQCTYT